MVFQQLPWLRPTGANKMYNAVMDFEGDGGIVKDFNAHDYREDGSRNVKHFDAVKPWLAKLELPVHTFSGVNGTSFDGRVGILASEEVVSALDKFELLSRDQLAPTTNMIMKASTEGHIQDWAVIVPELPATYRRWIEGSEVSLMQRRRRNDRPGFTGSERRHRAALEVFAQKPDREVEAGAAAAALSTPTRGAILLTFSIDPETAPETSRDEYGELVKRENWPDKVGATDVATLVSLALPHAAAPRGRIGFRVRREDQKDTPIIDI
jgi:hypothetical protein